MISISLIMLRLNYNRKAIIKLMIALFVKPSFKPIIPIANSNGFVVMILYTVTPKLNLLFTSI